MTKTATLYSLGVLHDAEVLAPPTRCLQGRALNNELINYILMIKTLYSRRAGGRRGARGAACLEGHASVASWPQRDGCAAG